jgi:hypothetical protein
MNYIDRDGYCLENLAPFGRFPYAQRASRDVDDWQY